MANGVLIRSLKKEKEYGSKVAIWWKPRQMGYTDNVWDAGVYQEEKAKQIIDDGTPNGNVIVTQSIAVAKADGGYQVAIKDLPAV